MSYLYRHNRDGSRTINVDLILVYLVLLVGVVVFAIKAIRWAVNS